MKFLSLIFYKDSVDYSDEAVWVFRDTENPDFMFVCRSEDAPNYVYNNSPSFCKYSDFYGKCDVSDLVMSVHNTIKMYKYGVTNYILEKVYPLIIEIGTDKFDNIKDSSIKSENILKRFEEGYEFQIKHLKKELFIFKWEE